MKTKSFECIECDCTYQTDDYWYQTDFTDNGPVEIAYTACPICNELVEE